jgi:ABC-type uncharacterized transport system substrate-binding protein
MRRREFIALVTGAAASVYSARCSAQAQPSTVYRLGYLAPGRIPYVLEAFQDGLRQLGYVEGQNLKIEYRFLHESGTSPDALAAELVQLGPDLIVAVATRIGYLPSGIQWLHSGPPHNLLLSAPF